MSCRAGTFFTLFSAGLKDKKANRRSLSRLDKLFREAASCQDILADFKLEGAKISILKALASRQDGWYPIPEICSGNDARSVADMLTSLAEEGLIHLKAFKNLIKLSDSGRFILILCAEITSTLP